MNASRNDSSIPKKIAAYIKLVNALNAMEDAGVPAPYGVIESDMDVFTDAYTVTWDSMAERWTLVSESDDFPELCPFNKTVYEGCSPLSPCADCTRVQVAVEDTGRRA